MLTCKCVRRSDNAIQSQLSPLPCSLHARKPPRSQAERARLGAGGSRGWARPTDLSPMRAGQDDCQSEDPICKTSCNIMERQSQLALIARPLGGGLGADLHLFVKAEISHPSPLRVGSLRAVAHYCPRRMLLGVTELNRDLFNEASPCPIRPNWSRRLRRVRIASRASATPSSYHCCYLPSLQRLLNCASITHFGAHPSHALGALTATVAPSPTLAAPQSLPARIAPAISRGTSEGPGTPLLREQSSLRNDQPSLNQLEGTAANSSSLALWLCFRPTRELVYDGAGSSSSYQGEPRRKDGPSPRLDASELSRS